MSAPRDYIGFFEDMLLEAKLAQQFLAGVAYDDFLENLEKQRAVVRSVEVIGEAARNVPKAVRQKYPEIEWTDIIGMRDRLIHGYGGIDYKPVWDTVTVNLPMLERQIERILGELDAEGKR